MGILTLKQRELSQWILSHRGALSRLGDPITSYERTLIKGSGFHWPEPLKQQRSFPQVLSQDLKDFFNRVTSYRWAGSVSVPAPSQSVLVHQVKPRRVSFFSS